MKTYAVSYKVGTQFDIILVKANSKKEAAEKAIRITQSEIQKTIVLITKDTSHLKVHE